MLFIHSANGEHYYKISLSLRITKVLTMYTYLTKNASVTIINNKEKLVLYCATKKSYSLHSSPLACCPDLINLGCLVGCL